LDDALGILDDLVAFPSVALTPNVDLIAWVVDRLDGVASDIRLSHDATGTRANLFATIGPVVDGGIMLAGHSDVVPVDPDDWTSPPFVATRRDDRIYGRGTADMKGFVACVLALAPRWAALDLALPVHLALTYDEEDGFHGAPVLIDSLAGAPRPAAAIVGEPTGLQVVGAHKGCYEYTTTVTGMDGHSSHPAEAVSAVHHATRWIGGLLGLAEGPGRPCTHRQPLRARPHHDERRRRGRGAGPLHRRRGVLVRVGDAPGAAQRCRVRQGPHGRGRSGTAGRDAHGAPGGVDRDRGRVRDRRPRMG
jgi:acetylornithine deacetylase/succinyl-diaminopimelate desuccinylase-like protein